MARKKSSDSPNPYAPTSIGSDENLTSVSHEPTGEPTGMTPNLPVTSQRADRAVPATSSPSGRQALPPVSNYAPPSGIYPETVAQPIENEKSGVGPGQKSASEDVAAAQPNAPSAFPADPRVEEIPISRFLRALDASDSSVEGETYVGSSMLYYTKPVINADTLKDALQNNYIMEHLDRLRKIVFSQGWSLQMFRPDGEEDEDMSNHVVEMLESPSINWFFTMQQIWVDIWSWGCSLFNPVWQDNGSEVVLQRFRRLPPHSFRIIARSPHPWRYSQILQGITLGLDGNLECWQYQSNSRQQLLKNVMMFRDPASTELAGTSKLIPLMPVVNMLNFAWNAQAQKLNRIGAPILFIKFTAPPVVNSAVKRDDIAYAKLILDNWGRSTAYQLRENMEVVELKVPDNATAVETIKTLEERIDDYFDPTKMLEKTGKSSIGGNGAAQSDLAHEWIHGEHRWLQTEMGKVIDRYIQLNPGLAGYTSKFSIEEPQPNTAELDLKQAQIGWQTRALTLNEVREKLGADEATPEIIAQIKEDWDAVAPTPAPSPFGDSSGQFGAKDGDKPTIQKDEEDDGMEVKMKAPSDEGAIVTMPFPNFHSARIKNPGEFNPKSFRTITITSGVTAVIGKPKGSSKTETQAFRFDRKKFSASDARAWLKKHDKHPISFHPAKESTQEASIYTKAGRAMLKSPDATADDVVDRLVRGVKDGTLR